MNKRLVISFLMVGMMATVYAQDFPELDKSPLDISYYPSRVAFRAFAKTDEGKNQVPVMRVVYSRPSKNDREVFGNLIKYGEVWRIGANESTEVTFMQEVTVGDKKIAAGRYTAYAMVNESEWTVYFSSDLDGWGHYAFKPEESTLAQVTVPVSASKSTIEQMGIIFEEADGGVNMVIGWDNTIVKVPIGL
ncbi:MAG: DUF2911 domain-containing protein [Cyclobacteriaceae bacterium]